MKTTAGWMIKLFSAMVLLLAHHEWVRADEGLGPTRIETEESLVWRTRVRAEVRNDWAPSGFHYGVAKPYGFAITSTCGLPFRKQWEIPSIIEAARWGWETEGPIRLSDQPDDPTQASDAPQFGVKVVSDHSGLRLTRPTFLLPPAPPDARLVTQRAQMGDAIEFRVEAGREGSAIFSIHNDDPRTISTFHNLRFTVSENEIRLDDPILLDQLIPLAHWFSDERQSLAPPVVRPKTKFVTFRQQFPEIAFPLIVGSGLDSRQFVLADLPVGMWVYVEGFATRTDREGRPLLDPKGLPERPSEFRYGFRLVERTRVKVDLARFIQPTSVLHSSPSTGASGLFPLGTQLGPLNPSGFGSPWLGLTNTGPASGSGSGNGGGLGGLPVNPGTGGVTFPTDQPASPIPTLPTDFIPSGTPVIPSGPGTTPGLPSGVTPGGNSGGSTPPGGGPGGGSGPGDPVVPIPAASVPEPATILGWLLGMVFLTWAVRSGSQRAWS